ncbi:hypothetical protein OY671_010931, partial [Metschnikowia pulcherrima]
CRPVLWPARAGTAGQAGAALCRGFDRATDSGRTRPLPERADHAGRARSRPQCRSAHHRPLLQGNRGAAAERRAAHAGGGPCPVAGSARSGRDRGASRRCARLPRFPAHCLPADSRARQQPRYSDDGPRHHAAGKPVRTERDQPCRRARADAADARHGQRTGRQAGPFVQ